MVGRPKAELVVSDEDRATLTRWTARRTTAQALALRSRIILRCATGVPNIVVAEELGVADQTVCKWRSRFIKKAWRDCWTNRGQVYRARSPTIRWKPSSSRHWSPRRVMAPTGVSVRWPPPRA